MTEEAKDGIWSLEINTGGTVSCVTGSYEVMNFAIGEWKAWLKNPVRDEHDFVEVSGSMDDHARSQVETISLMTDITGMSMREAYR